jgi:hypothetical protein
MGAQKSSEENDAIAKLGASNKVEVLSVEFGKSF